MSQKPGDSGMDYSIHYGFFHDDSPSHRKALTQAHRAWLSNAMPENTSASVLDIGCGWGFTLSALNEMGYRDSRGIDLDEGQARKCQAYGLTVERVSDSASYLAAHLEAFDVVIMFDLLEHLAIGQQIPFLRAVYKSLRPAGRAILTVPNASHPLAMRWRYIDHTHACSFTEHSLRFVLLNGGFDRVWIEPASTQRRPSLRLWKLSARQELLRRAMKSLWRRFLQAEMPWEHLDNLSLELNLFCIAYKQPAV
jgi:2-polyprenyl-3-methyl-5-hydroxy-6-metoxy-1,4-benzoquinol methylase